MDHLDAENMKAVERYMLGELSVSEVEDFERHFFDCPQCSEELRALTIFQENARAVFAEQDLAPMPAKVNAPQSADGRWSWLSPLFFGNRAWGAVAAALIVGIFAGYLAFSRKEDVQQVSQYPLYAEARGEENIIAPAAGSKSYALYLDKNWDGNYASYRAVVRDSSGSEKLALPVKPAESIQFSVPSHKLDSGKYVLVMYGRNGDKETELARYPFTLQVK